MIDVGLVGLDTSHAEAFAEELNRLEATNVTAVWDGGAVRSSDYAETFCDQYDATLYKNSHDLIDVVDAAMILTVDWNTHADLAVPFLEADTPTFIDKPIAGLLTDVKRIDEAAGDTPLFGGSAVPFHPSFEDFPVAERNRTLYCAGYGDPFYYGAHLVNVVRRYVGAEWLSVSPSSGPGISAQVEFANDTRATLRFDGPQNESAYGILDVGTKTRTRRIDGNERAHQLMYERFLDEFVDSVRGEREDKFQLIDGAQLLLATHAAIDADETVTPESETLREFHVEGEAFLEEYAPYY